MIEGQSRDQGVIALQIHQGPPMTVRFKNIMIRSRSSQQKRGFRG